MLENVVKHSENSAIQKLSIIIIYYYFTSTETNRVLGTGSPGQPPRPSHSSWALNIQPCLGTGLNTHIALVVVRAYGCLNGARNIFCSSLPSEARAAVCRRIFRVLWRVRGIKGCNHFRFQANRLLPPWVQFSHNFPLSLFRGLLCSSFVFFSLPALSMSSES